MGHLPPEPVPRGKEAQPAFKDPAVSGRDNPRGLTLVSEFPDGSANEGGF